MSESNLFLLLSSIFIVVMFLVLSQKFLSILKLRYPEVFEKLGKPGMLHNLNWAACKHFFVYIKEKDYLQLDDEDITSLGQAIGLLYKVGIMFFIGIIVVIFITTIRG